MKEAIIGFIIGTILVVWGFVLMSSYFPYSLSLNICGGLLIGWNFMDMFSRKGGK